MKALIALAVVLFLCSCRTASPQSQSETPQNVEASPAKTDFQARAGEFEERACKAHAVGEKDCGRYRVLSYDATWHNAQGNEGRFVIERDGLRIHAHCGSENCYVWIDGVGRTVMADNGVTDLITHHKPSCQDRLFVKNSLENYHRMTGRVARESDVCNQTLIVEKIEAIDR